MNNALKTIVRYRSLWSVVCGLLAIECLYWWGRTHWELVRMVHEGVRPSGRYLLAAMMAKPASVVLSGIALMFYFKALRRNEPVAIRCLALVFLLPGFMALLLVM